MDQKKYCYNVLKCLKLPFSCCALIGSFDNKDEAEKCKEEKNKKLDNNLYILLIHELEYKI
jgi:hypothetical protein